MLFLLLVNMPSNLARRISGQLRTKAITTGYGLQVLAPDTPYVTAAGPDKLYFIDTRFDTETAKHVKEQIEKATVHNPEKYIAIDEDLATAELKKSVTGETTFVFEPSMPVCCLESE
jgi:hypothetical protein